MPARQWFGPSTGPRTRMYAGFRIFLQKVQKFLRKTLKFAAALPLPISEAAGWGEKAASVRCFGWSEKNLKFFAGNPKVLLSSVVTLFRCRKIAASGPQIHKVFSFRRASFSARNHHPPTRANTGAPL
jgi:hypothetical protein